MSTSAAVRKALFTPCKTKEELDRWIRVFLQIRLPDRIVSDESNASPLGVLWELYDRAVRNDVEGWQRSMTYASRFSGKTLAASILELLIVLHTDRNIVHMAAIVDQAKKAQEYVKDFFERPHIRDFVVGDNAKEVVVVRYIDKKTGVPLTEEEFSKSGRSVEDFFYKKNYIRIIACTMQSTNGQHVEFMCVDGQSQVLIKDDSENRSRKPISAKGLFRYLQGLSPSGRYRETEGQIIPSTLVEAATFDWATGAIKFSPITFATAKQADVVEIKTDSKRLVATPDHQIWSVDRGAFVELSELVAGEAVAILDKGHSASRLFDKKRPPRSDMWVYSDSNEWFQVMLGSLLGDGGVYRKDGDNAFYSERHSFDQENYFRWKIGILGQNLRIKQDLSAVSGYTGEPQLAFRSGNSPMLNEWVSFKKDLNDIDKLDALGLAVWYMDDGHACNGFRISTCGFSKEQNDTLRAVLKSNFDIEVDVVSYDGYFYLDGGVAAKRRLVEVCRPFIHPSMAYKFDVQSNIGQCRYCGSDFLFVDQGSAATTCDNSVCRAIAAGNLKVEKVKEKSPIFSRFVYDFTVDGTNNLIVNGFLSHQCVDEVDVIEKKNVKAYHQAKGGVPTARNGMEAMTLFTSTRKSRVGLVQKEIDGAVKPDGTVVLRLNHWNIIDITEPCEPERHRPEEPKQTYWINDDQVTHITDAQYEALPEGEKSKWYSREGFAGCAKCPLFAACKSRLATHQVGKAGKYEDGGTALLLPIREVISKFQGATPEFITTEYLCFGPGAEVLMANGTTKKIEDVRVGDSVITHTGKNRRVVNTFAQRYKGPVLAFTSPARNKHTKQLLVTPEHPFFVNGNKFTEASSVVPWKFDKWGGIKQKGDYLSFPMGFEATKTHIETKTGQIPLDYNFGWIIGYFLAEGCVIFANGKIKNLTFSSDVRETEYHERVKDWFKKTYEHKCSGNGYVQVINNVEQARLFLDLAGRYSDKKVIREDLLCGPIDFQRGILEGFDAGDGTKQTSCYKELTTTSKNLASQLSLIAGRLGLCPRIQQLKKSTGKKQAYRVVYQKDTYVSAQKRTAFVTAEGYNLYRPELMKPVDYDGFVYNIEVEEDNSYIVDGIATHNCRKPDTSGLVYPRLNEEIHRKTPAQIATLVTGEEHPSDMSKEELIGLLVNKGARFATGMDFGYNHMFVAVTIAVWGQLAFVVDAVGRSHMERDDQLNETEHLRDKLNSQIYPDPEDAGAIATFKRKGYRIKEWSKNAGSVKAGIEIVRAKLWTKGPGATLFFLNCNDPDIDLLYKHMRDYRFDADAAGQFTDVPDEENDDYPDGLRYVVMNIFGKDGGLKNNTGLTSVSEAAKEEHWAEKVKKLNEKALSGVISGLTGTTSTSDGQTVAPKKIKHKGFYFDG